MANNINNFTDQSIVSGTNDDDSIRSLAEYATINAGDGNDTIYNSYISEYSMVNAGAGNDSIFNGSSSVTIDAGPGNDTITNAYNQTHKVYLYASGDGDDLIELYDSTDTIRITDGSSYSTVESDSDVIIKIGSGAITLRNAVNKTINIVGGYFSSRSNLIWNETTYSLVSGTSGDDSIYNESGGVTIQAGDGNDYINNSTIDTINNSYGYVTIDAGAGDDTIYNLDPYVSINGGAGNDSIYLSSYNSNTVRGGTGNDTISGTGNYDVFIYSGGDGNDLITGYNSTDTIRITDNSTYSTMTSGSDVIVSIGNGSIRLQNASGKTLNIVGGSNPANGLSLNNSTTYSLVSGSLGNDTIRNSAGGVTINAGAGDDSIYVNTLYTINDSYGYVTIDAGAGNDTIHVIDPNVSINGGAGNDSIYLSSYSSNTVRGGTGNDTIDGIQDSAVFEYSSGDGNDLIAYTSGEDTLRIVDGSSYSTMTSGDDLIVSIGSGSITVKGGASKPLEIVGATRSDVIENYTSNILVNGTSRADSIRSLATYATIDGGSGNDTIYNSYVSSYSSVSGGAGDDSIFNGSSNVTINGGTGNDTITNSTSSSRRVFVYRNGDGNDIINGYQSTDTIQIADGSYSTEQSDSDVIIRVGTGSITLVDAADANLNIVGTPVSVNTTPSGTSRSTLIANSRSNTLISGTTYADSIRSWDYDYVTINGGNGNDTLSLSGQHLSVLGGNDNDSIYMYANTTDTTVFAGAGNDSIFDGGIRSVLFGQSDDDYIYLFSNASNTTIDGGAGNDSIYSGSASVTINGGTGNDYIRIYDNSVDNTVRGGAGNDTIDNGTSSFVYQFSGTDGKDLIKGFNSSSRIVITDGTYSTMTSGSNTIINVGVSAITLENYIGTLNIDGTPEVVKNEGVTIDNSSPNRNLEGTVYDDSISNDASYVSIRADAGNDSIYNDYGSYITIDAGAGDDSIKINIAEYISINGGLGDDLIEGSNNNGTLHGGTGNDTITGNHFRSVITGDAGNDLISLGAYSYNTIDGGIGNDTIFSGGIELSVNGGSGDDLISLSGSDLTVRGGMGNDTIYGNARMSHLYQYANGDGDDLIVGFNADDTLTISGGSYTTSTVGNNVLVRVGSGTITLEGARSQSININNVQPTPDTTPSGSSGTGSGSSGSGSGSSGSGSGSSSSSQSPQDVIKTFMKSLDEETNTYSGITMLDNAIRSASNGKYTSAQQVVNDMIADCRSYRGTTYGWKSFLLDKCDIDLDNEDTGAITGSDAGGSTAKGSSAVVPEYGSVDRTFTGDSFTINGLTAYLAKWSDLSETVTPIDYYDSSLDSNKRYMWQALRSWWLQSSFDLISESYGNNFGFDSNSSSTITDSSIAVTFVRDDDNVLAYVRRWSNSYTGDAVKLQLAINMKYYDNVIRDNADGVSSSASNYMLDRTLAHELTHAVMGANINRMGNLPSFILEGMAELTHGIDDERTSSIRSLASDPDRLSSALSLTRFSTSVDVYSAGYMFLRYVAKQCSSRADVNTSAMRFAVLSDRLADGIEIDGETLTATASFVENTIDLADYDSEITKVDATSFTKGITILGSVFGDDIDGGHGADNISGGAGNDTIHGNEGNDTLDGGSGDDYLYGGAGADSLIGGIGSNTMTGGSGADVFVHMGDEDLITDYRAGEDKIKLASGSLVSTSVEGSDVIFNTGGGLITVRDAKGTEITIIDYNGAETTKIYGRDALTEDNWQDFEGVTLNRAKTALTLESPFEGTVDAANFSAKLKKLDASDASRAVELIGNAKANVLRAGSGGSTLDGGVGNDKLYGGDGRDVFVFDGQGKDKVYDFSAGDAVRISEGEITKVKVSGKNVAFTVGKGKLTLNKAVGVDMVIIDANGQSNTYNFTKQNKTFETALISSGTAEPLNLIASSHYWFLDGTDGDELVTDVASSDSPLDSILDQPSVTDPLAAFDAQFDPTSLQNVVADNTRELTAARHRANK